LQPATGAGPTASLRRRSVVIHSRYTWHCCAEPLRSPTGSL
jgi:hypothetical protein